MDRTGPDPLDRNKGWDGRVCLRSKFGPKPGHVVGFFWVNLDPNRGRSATISKAFKENEIVIDPDPPRFPIGLDEADEWVLPLLFQMTSF